MNEAVYSSDEIVIDGWEFTRLRLKDQDFISSRLLASSCPSLNWYNDFAFFWLFDQSRKARKVIWKSFGDLVVPFIINTNRRKSSLLRPPFGIGAPDDYVRVLDECVRFCREYNGDGAKEPLVRSVDEAELEFMRQSPHFGNHFALKRRKGIEHHYEVDQVCDLKGSQFAYVRRKLSKFARNHPGHVVRPYTASDKEQMLRLFELWLEDAKTEKERERKRGERRYFSASLAYGSHAGHRMLVLEVDGAIVGMISGGVRAVGDAWCFQRKSLHAYEGAAELLVVELAKAIRQQDPTVRYLNDGSDLGDPGLRYFKEHFNAGRTVSRYRLYGNF